MKRIIHIAAVLLLCLCANAQVTTIVKDGKIIGKIFGSEGLEFINQQEDEPIVYYDTVIVKEEVQVHDTIYTPDTPRNFLPGLYSVSQSKTVMFTKSNIYWNGRAFMFEKNQTDYQTSWDATHVSHFYWTNNASASYTEEYNESSCSVHDTPFFAESRGGVYVDGTYKLFALSIDEWKYLLNTRTNAASLRMHGVSVSHDGTTYTNCLILAPDDFTGTLQSSYTLEEINTLGLVCMPAAGYYIGTGIVQSGTNAHYWTSTPHSDYENLALYLRFNSREVSTTYSSNRSYGRSVRLVAVPKTKN